MEQLTSSKLIPDLETSLVEYVKEKLKEKLAKHSAKKISTYRGADVYSFGDDENGYITLVSDNQVVYFVRVRRIRHNGFRLGRQVLLWRDPQAGLVTSGFAQRVFFNILLPRYGALIADKEQTRNGAAFWSNACDAALARGLNVYCLDRRSRKSVLTKLEDSEALDAFAKTLWGNTPAHSLTFAVISNKRLTLQTKP